MPPPRLSVVVPCHDRMDLLARTLHALAGQRLPGGVAWEVVVADNHPDALARPLVEGFAAPVPFRHIPATPHRNIAAARNRGVVAARGEFVAFVDDDEAPEEGCLAAHLAALERTGADASFGPKFPVFEGGAPPDWDPEGEYFRTDLALPADTRLNPLHWWHAGGRGVGTGNSMLRRATCLPGAAPFNETLGRAGGEDTLLFFTLAKEGRHFIWTPGARVVEVNQRGRLTPDYMRARLARSARHSALFRAAVSDRKWAAWAMAWGIGAAQVAVHAPLYLLKRRGPPSAWMRHRFGIAKGLGKLGLGADLDFVRE
ncbi:glycosyltransferase family 2 protein [Roseococcus suduntuyensis]|uniref:Glycosyltransferase involved in cell wall biosynthesis n=1 Tax=Roseococcus suduntuyensis TaxID=455361 RepID=A0A840AAD5_9PROT|nr:glycosyltransferase family 2 protein [Roseococcus suduntuyensis]MBB3897244.1 glycosyltransferase involved in cell wall biosynthesis [Roseococcus suduntuyensis]